MSHRATFWVQVLICTYAIFYFYCCFCRFVGLFLVFSFYCFVIIVTELTHSKTILENTVEIAPQPVALDFKNLSQNSTHSK